MMEKRETTDLTGLSSTMFRTSQGRTSNEIESTADNETVNAIKIVLLSFTLKMNK